MNTLIDVVTLGICVFLISCGRPVEPGVAVPVPAPTDVTVPLVVAAPSFVPSGTPTATPAPTPTTYTYIFQNINLCTDILTWNFATETIKTYGNVSNLDSSGYFLIRADGVFLVSPSGGCSAGCVSPDLDLIRSNSGGEVCRIKIRNGKYAGVAP